MAQCSQCGSQNLEFKSGISQKNNRPWKGNKCLDCGNMDFIRQSTPTKAPNSPNRGNSAQNRPIVGHVCDPEKNASITSLALCKVMATAGAYNNINTPTSEERKQMFENVYSDFVDFRNRELSNKEESPF